MSPQENIKKHSKQNIKNTEKKKGEKNQDKVRRGEISKWMLQDRSKIEMNLPLQSRIAFSIVVYLHIS